MQPVPQENANWLKLVRDAGSIAAPLGIGKGLRTKVNANIGTSRDRMSIDDEIAKLKVAVSAGADAVMDLSTGGPIIEIRREILKQSTVSIGTVPIYQAAVETVAQGKSIVQMDPEVLFRVIEQQAEEGVDFVTGGDNIRVDGRLPLNTHGGQIGFGQPDLAGGMTHVVEAVRQLRGGAGARQIKNARRALVTGNGATMSEAVALVLGAAA